jgi:putative membrane protein
MIVRTTVRRTEVLISAWRRVLFTVLYAAAFVFLYKQGYAAVAIPVAVPAMLGTALSILLGFRTNSAYDRWWEARKIWGAIVNDSRTFTRQVLSLIVVPVGTEKSVVASLQKELVYRQIAWNHALNRSLRRQDPFPEIEPLLPPNEVEALRGQDNRPNALLQTQALRIQDAHRMGCLDRIYYLPLDDTLTRLCDSMGRCERIKSTVFPAHYSFFVARMVWLFFLLLPAGLVDHLGWVTVPVSFFVGAIFWLMEAVGRDLQDPFEDRATDTPMTAICRTIEINLRQQLGETELPEKIQPVDGVLM